MDSPSQTTCLLTVVTVMGRNIKQRPNLQPSSEGWSQHGNPNFFTQSHPITPLLLALSRGALRRGYCSGPNPSFSFLTKGCT